MGSIALNPNFSPYGLITNFRAFTQKELEDLKSFFESLAAKSQNNAQYITLPVFKVTFCQADSSFSFPFLWGLNFSTPTMAVLCCEQAYIGIEGPLGDRLFDLVTQKRKDQKLTFQDLVIAKVSCFLVLCRLTQLFRSYLFFYCNC